MICGWPCYRSFSPSLMFTVLVVFRFFKRKWVGGFNSNGFFLFLSLSLSVCLSVCVLSICAQCVVRGKDEVACAEFFFGFRKQGVNLK